MSQVVSQMLVSLKLQVKCESQVVSQLLKCESDVSQSQVVSQISVSQAASQILKSESSCESSSESNIKVSQVTSLW